MAELAAHSKILASLTKVPVAKDLDVGANNLLTSRPLIPDDPKVLTRAMQTELKRTGCYAGPIDGDWGGGSRRGDCLIGPCQQSLTDRPNNIASKLELTSRPQRRCMPSGENNTKQSELEHRQLIHDQNETKGINRQF